MVELSLWIMRVLNPSLQDCPVCNIGLSAYDIKPFSSSLRELSVYPIRFGQVIELRDSTKLDVRTEISLY